LQQQQQQQQVNCKKLITEISPL